jgi:hypothetical protein
VPDGPFDYANYDPRTGNIYMARADSTTVIDPKTGKVSELKNAVRGHMALPLPGTSLFLLPQASRHDPDCRYGKRYYRRRLAGRQESRWRRIRPIFKARVRDES